MGQLSIAAIFAPVVRCLQTLFFPLAVPIKQLLDLLVGHAGDGPKYSRAQLKALLRLHVEGAPQEPDQDELSSEASDGTEMIGLMDWKTAGACLLSLEEGSLEDGSRSESRECEEPERSLLQLECRLARQSLELSRLEL